MSPLEISQIFIGIAFFLFIPGYLLTLIFFSKQEKLEKIMLSIVFSIMIGMAIGIFFGYNESQVALTGGFIFNNIFITEIGVTLLLAIILYFKRIKQRKSHNKGTKK